MESDAGITNRSGSASCGSFSRLAWRRTCTHLISHRCTLPREDWPRGWGCYRSCGSSSQQLFHQSHGPRMRDVYVIWFSVPNLIRPHLSTIQLSIHSKSSQRVIFLVNSWPTSQLVKLVKTRQHIQLPPYKSGRNVEDPAAANANIAHDFGHRCVSRQNHLGQL